MGSAEPAECACVVHFVGLGKITRRPIGDASEESTLGGCYYIEVMDCTSVRSDTPADGLPA